MYNRNIIKYGWVEVQEEEKCVIDSNSRMTQRMEELEAAKKKRAAATDSEAGEDGFMGGLGAERLDDVEYDENGESGNVIKAAEESEPEGPTPEEILAQAQAELEAAREEAEQMKSLARTEIDAQRREVLEEAKRTGYSDGYEMAQKEAAKIKSDLEAQRRRLEAEYNELIDELEPRFIDTITALYKHVFNIGLANDKEILVHLIDSTLRRIDSSRTFIVHVSQDDYEFVNTQKKELTEKTVSGRGVVEVVEDITLRKNECMIETDGGIFDCGIGTQLEELTKRLKLLSFTAE